MLWNFLLGKALIKCTLWWETGRSLATIEHKGKKRYFEFLNPFDPSLTPLLVFPLQGPGSCWSRRFDTPTTRVQTRCCKSAGIYPSASAEQLSINDIYHFAWATDTNEVDLLSMMQFLKCSANSSFALRTEQVPPIPRISSNILEVFHSCRWLPQVAAVFYPQLPFS